MLAGGRWSLLLALVATPALLASAGDVSCTYSDSETCPVEDFTPSTADGSVLVYPGGLTRCAFDDYTDTKTTFTARSTYFFQVFPTEGLDKSKLMIFFQGGGACIDKYTCNFALQCSLGASSTFTTSATASSAGVLDRSLEDNMFNDWNIVHIPYCTGDLHAGSKTTVGYQSGIEALLGNTQCLGLNKSMHMNGYANTQSALQWALANYPEPEHIVIGGESAGSLAAQAYSTYVADLWDVEAKAIKYQVLADSYVGVFPEEQTPAGVILDYFGVCDVDFGAPADIVAACKAQTLTVSQLMSSLLALIPSSEWLFIDSKADTTQRTFYELVAEGIFGYPFTNIISATDFFSNMTAIIDVYEGISSGISTFFVEGTKHVLLNDANFTNVVSDTGAVLGATLTSWLDSNSTPSTPTPTATATPTTPTGTTTSSPTATPTATPTTTATSTPGTTTATPSVTTSTPSTTTTAPSPGSTPSTTTAPSTPSTTPSSGGTPATTSPTPATTAPLAC